jgi:UDP-N-acetylmuramyl pentapeptide phosphotransferase/UDP-N-acetylglucosamine-1-phosphate transferase
MEANASYSKTTTYIMIYGIITVFFIVVMIVYFRIADYYNIIDHPNERSSHAEVTIRGGGIVFLSAAVADLILYPHYWLPVSGILIIGIISFLDDRITLSTRIRLLFHLISVTVMFFYLNIFHIESFYICFLLYIMVIGVINMYNFMDGINGITGAYSLVVLGGLQYVNLSQTAFVQPDIIWVPIFACGVFLYFNFRAKAKCFAGDVGSVTIAFWIIMLLLKLILLTNNWTYILFLAVYGVDSCLTVVHRLILKQNIFKAHRLHFYQLLVNEQKIPHLLISAGYSIVQCLIILLILCNSNWPGIILFIIVVVPLVFAYLAFKPKLMKLMGN